MQRQGTATRGRKRSAKSNRAKTGPARDEDDLDTDETDDLYPDVLWSAATLGAKERSRVKRQMKARLELERRLEEKRLRMLVDDWCFDDIY